jgi:pilus assembly protein CpaC
LFRSTGFQNDQTELVIIVTPRLVAPVRANALKAPTDRVGPPNDADLLLLGRTDTGVPPAPAPFVMPPAPPPAGPVIGGGSGNGGMAAKQPIGFEKDYGHVL